MAATVVIAQYTGGGAGASGDVTSGSIKAGTSDEQSASTIPVPSSGSNYSYWVHTALVATAAPDNSLTNLGWYTDGTNSLGTGVDGIVSTACRYAQAAGTAGSSGQLLNLSNHASLTGCPADGSTSPFFLYTSSCVLSIAGSLGAATGSAGDVFVVWQINVGTTAGAGNSAEETITFSFDES